jgi:hypothetical protein
MRGRQLSVKAGRDEARPLRVLRLEPRLHEPNASHSADLRNLSKSHSRKNLANCASSVTRL